MKKCLNGTIFNTKILQNGVILLSVGIHIVCVVPIIDIQPVTTALLGYDFRTDCLNHQVLM